MLVVLSDVVRKHFFLRRPAILDPVLTSSEQMLRLEGFSGCCGVYVRADLPVTGFDGDSFGRGTTNVDFNDPMRRALKAVQGHEQVSLSVGRDEVVLERSQGQVVEKKVKLPVRWLKAFGEVQTYQPRFQLKLEVDAQQALSFVRSLPKSAPPKQTSYVRLSGRSLRLSQRSTPDAVALNGTHRVAPLEPLLLKAEGLRVWSDPGTLVSGWEVHGKAGRLLLVLSPEVYRGFSGEGQMLETLASGAGAELLTRVRAGLKWQASIDPEEVARATSSEAEVVEGALYQLGAAGLAGYDLHSRTYFHRELPFDLEVVDRLQPRLAAARKLVEEEAVKPFKKDEYTVDGSQVCHHVRLLEEGDRCTCRWFLKYQGSRGPCKHILAAQLCHES